LTCESNAQSLCLCEDPHERLRHTADVNGKRKEKNQGEKVRDDILSRCRFPCTSIRLRTSLLCPARIGPSPRQRWCRRDVGSDPFPLEGRSIPSWSRICQTPSARTQTRSRCIFLEQGMCVCVCVRVCVCVCVPTITMSSQCNAPTSLCCEHECEN
jgi:hypothetical protein